MIILYVPCGSEDEAKEIARALVEEKMIACANIHTSESIYEWKGSTVEGNEWVLLLKTVEARYGDVLKRIKELHSYETPCIMRIPVTANSEFEMWVKKQCS